jgi:hypothetical protein
MQSRLRAGLIRGRKGLKDLPPSLPHTEKVNSYSRGGQIFFLRFLGGQHQAKHPFSGAFPVATSSQEYKPDAQARAAKSVTGPSRSVLAGASGL